MSTHVERFAPSPTGRLHLGHAFSALTAFEAAKAAGGLFRLRHEDIDQARARAHFEAGIEADLTWLGIDWPRPALRQSSRMGAYRAALDRLNAMGLTYRCTCTRRDILAAADAPQEGGPDGPVYPGTCRTGGARPDAPAAIRLDMAAALSHVEPLRFLELGQGPSGESGEIRIDPSRLLHECGDIVLARRDYPTSYHLSVVVDDAYEGITHVTRGADLFSATPIHRLLQALLSLPVPIWHHHRLIRDETGRRLAKRSDDKAISILRAEGWQPVDIRHAVGLSA